MRRLKSLLPVMTVLWLAFGPAPSSGTPIDLRSSNAADVVLYGHDAEDFFGTDLAVGDINGDGIDDLAVGAYLADGPGNSRNGAGEVSVYYGRPADEWLDTHPSPDVIVYGAASGNALGGDWEKEPGHIAIGDLDGDGTGDLVVSAPTYGWGVSSHLGRVYVIWGRDDLPPGIDLARMPSNLEVTTVSAAARDFLGSTIAVGDFDGDGTDDLAMSAPLAEAESRQFSSGIVYVVFGVEGGGLRGRKIRLNRVPKDIAIFKAVGAASYTKLGSYLALGDLSNDSTPDLVIGSVSGGDGLEGSVDVVFGGSRLRNRAWDFRSKPPSWSAIGENAGDTLGRFLALGDVNGNGKTDLIATAPAADGPAGPGTGQAIGIFGRLKKGQFRDLGRDPGDLTVYGPQGGVDDAWLGESVAVADFNHDRVDDILVGARHANGFNRRNESGIVYVFYGNRALKGMRDLSRASADLTLVGAHNRDFTGYVTAGDINGDGVSDMITSATDGVGPAGQQAGSVYILFGK